MKRKPLPIAGSGFFVTAEADEGENMQAYTGFAAVYDTFMDNIPYEEWCGYLHTLLKKYDVTDGLVLELGCGTGTMT